MTAIAIVVGVLFVLWVLGHLKTGRADGTLVRVHPYRRLMFVIMPTRNESVVYFDWTVDADRLLAYLEKAKARFGADVTHAAVAAANIALADSPAMNRFVLGRRLYQRKGRSLTFSMKRKSMDRKAKLATVKMEMRDGETFAGMCARINEQIGVERSGQRTHADKEFDLFNLLPRPLLRGADKLLRLLDYFNVLPYAFIKTDPLYTSIFVANLGSLDMTPGYHHLYEYGNCPLFMMVGKVEAVPVVEDGKVVARRRLHIRYTFDERVDDGLTARYGMEVAARVLEDPERWLGCLAEDGSDARPMWPNEALTRPDALPLSETLTENQTMTPDPPARAPRHDH